MLKAKVEGTVLDVCEGCARFGEVIRRPAPIHTKNIPSSRPQAQMPARKEIVQMIVEDYAEKIRNAREKRGLKQEEFAKMLNQKESVMQKIEAGSFQPSINLARKLERKLSIKLIEEFSESGEVPLETRKSKTDGFTLGDFIKDKRKNK